MTDRERLVAELGQAHGVRVDPDDPILITALLNRRLLDEAMKALEMAVRTAANQMSVASSQQVEAAKLSAAALITDAGKWSADLLRNAATEAGATLLAEMRHEAERAERAGRMAVRVAWTVGGIGAVALAGIAGFWLAGK